jgi:hypothetical protein
MDITFHSSGLHDASIDLEFGGVQGMLTDLFISARFRRRGIGFLDCASSRTIAAGVGSKPWNYKCSEQTGKPSPSTGEPGFSRFRAW